MPWPGCCVRPLASVIWTVRRARARIRAQAPDADPEDLVLFDDLLGIGDREVELPKIDPGARRRRLAALVNAASLAREAPSVYVIEDAHWIDEVSESMLAEFLTVIPQTPSLVLVTYRPEYEGALTRVHGAQTIALAPLSDPETATLVTELLGSDPSVAAVRALIAGRTAGNPFFAQEIVRELAERGVLDGDRGSYICGTDVAEVRVPPTLQATIAARIDRLSREAKRTLNGAAVIGSRFGPDILTAAHGAENCFLTADSTNSHHAAVRRRAHHDGRIPFALAWPGRTPGDVVISARVIHPSATVRWPALGTTRRIGAMTEQDDAAVRKRRQEEVEKARAEHNSGEDVIFPESFRKL
jgi:hypothetical protein